MEQHIRGKPRPQILTPKADSLNTLSNWGWGREIDRECAVAASASGMWSSWGELDDLWLLKSLFHLRAPTGSPHHGHDTPQCGRGASSLSTLHSLQGTWGTRLWLWKNSCLLSTAPGGPRVSSLPGNLSAPTCSSLPPKCQPRLCFPKFWGLRKATGASLLTPVTLRRFRHSIARTQVAEGRAR